MLAEVSKENNHYLATFKRDISHQIEDVWGYLTENRKLKQWFPELTIEDLSTNGKITFDMQDGTFKIMTITDFKEKSILSFTWGEDHVHFELLPKQGGCQLILKETIFQLTDHTPKDLAGWHVCLDVILSLLDHKSIDRKEKWKELYTAYQQLLKTN